MDKVQILKEHLIQAERHVWACEAHINRQQRIIRDLERDGHVLLAAKAKDLLRQFSEALQMNLANCQRLSAELAELQLGKEKDGSPISATDQPGPATSSRT